MLPVVTPPALLQIGLGLHLHRPMVDSFKVESLAVERSEQTAPAQSVCNLAAHPRLRSVEERLHLILVLNIAQLMRSVTG